MVPVFGGQAQPHLVARVDPRHTVGRMAHDDARVAHLAVHQHLVAELLDQRDRAAQWCGVVDHHVLGPDAHLEATLVVGAFGEAGGQHVHGWCADEPGDEHRRRSGIHLGGRTHLFDAAAVHHGHPSAHGHRLDLVVSDVDERRTQPTVQGHQLGAGLAAQLGVEVAERFVHAEHGRLAHDRPGEGHTLSLAAAQLAGLAVQQVAEAQCSSRLFGSSGTFGLGHLAHLQRELDVRPHGLVGVEGVALEHHRHVALFRLDIVHRHATDRHGSAGGRLEAGDHAQQGALATPRGPQQHHELAVGDVEGDAVDCGDAVEHLGE